MKPKGIFVRLSLLLLFPCFSGDSTLLECYGLSTTAFKIGFWGSISGYSGSISWSGYLIRNLSKSKLYVRSSSEESEFEDVPESEDESS